MLAERSVVGVWLGIASKPCEHIIAKADVEAIRERTAQPCPEEDQRDSRAVPPVRALPRKPNQNTDNGVEQVEPQLNGDACDAGEAARAEAEDGGANIGRPAHKDAHGGPRKLRLDKRLLEKIGYPTGFAD